MEAEEFIKTHFKGIEKETWYPAIVAITEGFGKNQYNTAIKDCQKRLSDCGSGSHIEVQKLSLNALFKI